MIRPMNPTEVAPGPLPLIIAGAILLCLVLVARTLWSVFATLSFWSFFIGSLVPGLALLAYASGHPGETGVTFLAAGIHYLALGLVIGGIGGMFLPPSLIPPVRLPMGLVLCIAAGMALSTTVPGFKLPGLWD